MTTPYNPYAALSQLLPSGGRVAFATFLTEIADLEYANRSILRRTNKGIQVSDAEWQQLNALSTRIHTIYNLAKPSASVNELKAMDEIYERCGKLNNREVVPTKNAYAFMGHAVEEQDLDGAVEYFRALHVRTRRLAFRILSQNLGSPSAGKTMKNGLKAYEHDGIRHLVRDPIAALRLITDNGQPLYQRLQHKETDIAFEGFQGFFPHQPGQLNQLTSASSARSQTRKATATTTTSTSTTRSPANPKPASTTTTAKKGSHPDNQVVEDKLLQITRNLSSFNSGNMRHVSAFQFLLTDDTTYADSIAQNPNNEVIGPIFGDLVFNPKANSADENFLSAMKSRKWFKPAEEAIKAHASYSGFFRKSKIVINSVLIDHYLTQMNWKQEEKAPVFRFLKEVIKHCIIRDAEANAKTSKGDKSTSRPSLIRHSSMVNVSSSSKRGTTPEDLLIPFYTQGAKNNRGKTFEEILAMSDNELEKDHCYIQWLFPGFKKSDKNPTAPVLNKQLADAMSDPTVQNNLIRAFERMLTFYGFKIEINQTNGNKDIVRDKTKKLNWLKKDNHNFLRISRILSCLTKVGNHDAATAFLAQLEDIAASKEGKIAIPPAHEKNSALGIWRNAVVIKQPRHQPQPQSQPQLSPMTQSLSALDLTSSSQQTLPPFLPRNFPLHPMHQHHHHHHHQHQQQSLYPSLPSSSTPSIGTPNLHGPATVVVPPDSQPSQSNPTMITHPALGTFMPVPGTQPFGTGPGGFSMQPFSSSSTPSQFPSGTPAPGTFPPSTFPNLPSTLPNTNQPLSTPPFSFSFTPPTPGGSQQTQTTPTLTPFSFTPPTLGGSQTQATPTLTPFSFSFTPPTPGGSQQTQTTPALFPSQPYVWPALIPSGQTGQLQPQTQPTTPLPLLQPQQQQQQQTQPPKQ